MSLKTLLRIAATIIVLFGFHLAMSAALTLLNVPNDATMLAAVLIPLVAGWLAVQTLKFIWRKKKCENTRSKSESQPSA